jgi:hypothetical protein
MLTPCSASLASERWPPLPAVVLALLHSSRSYVETPAGAVVRSVTTVVPGRPPKAVLATPIAITGIIVGVSLLCFRFAFDQ